MQTAKRAILRAVRAQCRHVCLELQQSAADTCVNTGSSTTSGRGAQPLRQQAQSKIALESAFMVSESCLLIDNVSPSFAGPDLSVKVKTYSATSAETVPQAHARRLNSLFRT